jgi:thioredoxin-related protein
MRTLKPFFAALALTLIFAVSPSLAKEPAAGTVTGGKVSAHPDWFKESFLDLPADVDEAAGEGKHVILFLEMNGCPYCYKMLEENFKAAPYRDLIQQHFDVIAINVRGDREIALDAESSLTEKALADRLGVRYTPTLVFLDPSNRPVARVDGYRNPRDFERVLDYVRTKSYQHQTLSQYLDSGAAEPRYRFRDHPQIEMTTDLAALKDKPLALLFEDADCIACDALHDGHLADSAVREALGRFHLVCLDADSQDPIVAPDGSATTAGALAASLGLTYSPSLVLFDSGREIARIASMLYRYHFIGILEYVGEGHYARYPDSPFDYINAKTTELTAAGQDVSIADE